MLNGLLSSPAVSQQPLSRVGPAWGSSWGSEALRGGAGLRGPTVLSREELYARICVRDPYFALQDVTVLGPGEVVARVPVEQEPGAEASPISAAEVGRHLAILGSCAASLINPKEGQHYYLARSARLERLHGGLLPWDGGFLQGTARAWFTDRRSATARTLLSTAQGLPLFALDVEYHVLSAAAFTRLFQEARQDMRRTPRQPGGEHLRLAPGDFAAMRQNPYRQPLPLEDFVRDGDCLKASLGPIRAELCKGHFAMHPVLPVAMVMSDLSGLAGALLRQLLGAPDARYQVTRGEVRAESLAYAGQTVTFAAHRRGVEGRAHGFSCWAVVGERVVGEMELTLTLEE